MASVSNKWDGVYWVVLLLITLSLAGRFGYKLKLERKQTAAASEQRVKLVNDCNNILQDFTTVRLLELTSVGMSLEDISVLDVHGNPHKLGHLINRKTLVFRFWEGSCAPCLEDNIASIKGFDTVPIILLANFSSQNRFLSFAKEHGFSNLYMVEAGASLNSSPVETFQYLHYFITNANLKTSKLIVPINGYHSYTKSFLDNISSFF